MAFRDSPMADQVTHADIWLSRVNIAQVRSRNLLQSWAPKSAAAIPTPAEDNDEDDFVGMNESAGLGIASKDSDFEVDGILKRKPTSSNDKLLEQLLGKKAAAAKRKEQALARSTKSNIALGRTAPKAASGSATAVNTRSSQPAVHPADSEDDDEPGRAVTFVGKKVTRNINFPAYTTGDSGRRAVTPIEVDATPPDPREDPATIKAIVNGTDLTRHELSDSEEDQRPKKKKPTSYLDELLNNKRKKKKGKH